MAAVRATLAATHNAEARKRCRQQIRARDLGWLQTFRLPFIDAVVVH
jgi:hypothetical protein